ncbi:hypothetical protein AMIS_48670 [Actinoplanes missouriensis 431]|uniref:Uncharacterized protein n=1 Tax=Actinoplanes missouriensis (strain ATCC 14538 / DSM 43046 / CBS 188.64 / JCM 3121 / NBRC 102363 / NCIMB 12654 / NRRL B-3342 / UNCC 431) TaxID=512565 RepID=I0HAQ0_ACTM4|nr:hypothetical protein [Actinoplanes missouriensis]BAL90087.1 hypothetical protein AMIS_48670 [Actinoplanes missouriensis 431]
MPFLRQVRASIANSRAERRARRQLSDELAAFRTAAERSELDMILSRHSAEQTREIHAILNRQDADRRYQVGVAAHPN